MNNRITQLFQQKQRNILNVFFTAGHPRLEDTRPIIKELAQAGVDMIEIGIPFSDPIADGQTIQGSSLVALRNGMRLSVLFEQLEGIREEVDLPLLMMGYLNPVMQYGLEKFCAQAAAVGVDGLILPDLPMYEYETQYKELFVQHQLSHVFLITPQTSEARIRQIDELTDGFIYAVSSDSTTGSTQKFQPKQIAYFERLQAMKLSNPWLIGFGISDQEGFEQASRYAQGAIIGSAFIKALGDGAQLSERIQGFVQRIRGEQVGQAAH